MSKCLEALSYLDGIIANSNMTINVLKTLEAIKNIKKSLERLDKLEKVVEILKDKTIIVVDKNFIQITTNAIWRNDNSGGYDLLKEVFGDENS